MHEFAVSALFTMLLLSPIFLAAWFSSFSE